MPFGFTPQLDDRILSDLESLLKKVPKPWYAAFDADGTLWDTDVGEMFFRYQIQHCGLPDLPADPWAHYCEMKETQYRDACIWLAQINRGQKISQVQQWAHTNVHRNTPLPVFSAQKNLIKFLISREVKVVIVTASIQWEIGRAHV